MSLSENTVFFKPATLENVYGRQFTPKNRMAKNPYVEENLFHLDQRKEEDEDHVWKKRTKLYQFEMPKSTMPKGYQDSADRLLPLGQFNDIPCLSEFVAAQGPFYNHSFQLLSRRPGPNLLNDPRNSIVNDRIFTSPNKF